MLVILILAAACMASAPAFVSLYWLRIFTTICMFAAIAQSINLMAGFLGYPAFGNVVFFGLGAYGTAVAIVKFQCPEPLALGIALALCLCVVVIVGPPILRLRGHYFAIATLGLNEAIKQIVVNLTDLTGGGIGLSLPISKTPIDVFARYFYWMFLALAFVGIFTAGLMRRTRFGYACRAVRANEAGAESLGINATFYKTAAWTVSAVIAGVAGGLYSLWVGYIDAPTVFDMTIAVKGFVMFLIGGAGTVVGPLVGAIIVELATSLTWSYLLQYHLAVLGIIIMAAAILIPRQIPQSLYRSALGVFGVRLKAR
jgi:branched-chain amino acid transport system permease protein